MHKELGAVTDTSLLLRPEEAADVLAIGRSKLYELMATGQLDSVRIGRSRRVSRQALAAYVARLRDDATPGTTAAENAGDSDSGA